MCRTNLCNETAIRFQVPSGLQSFCSLAPPTFAAEPHPQLRRRATRNPHPKSSQSRLPGARPAPVRQTLPRSWAGKHPKDETAPCPLLAFSASSRHSPPAIVNLIFLYAWRWPAAIPSAWSPLRKHQIQEIGVPSRSYCGIWSSVGKESGHVAAESK